MTKAEQLLPMNALTVAWFSAGVSSAVATKLVIKDVDKIIYTHIDDQHTDTLRFVKDCEQWFGKPIDILQSELKDVESACLASGGRGYINGPAGAACTKTLKRKVRQKWEYEQPLGTKIRYVWGMDSSESHRCDRIRDAMPEFGHLFPLVDEKLSKSHVHEILKASGIKRPAMYDLGYPNNNCVGCVKGGKGYWNKIRVDFPDVFLKRSALERRIGASCINGSFLDELGPDEGRNMRPIVDDCGLFCELLALH